MEQQFLIYEKSAIAFIDILGFKNALKDKEKARGILDALLHVKEKIRDNYSDYSREVWRGIADIELTAFSDSIAISGSEGQTPLVLLTALDFSQILLEKGFLCRGAVVCGELFHKSGILFGDGFVKACQDEKRQAIYPRIILDSETVAIFEESNSLQPQDDFAGLIRKDKDGSEFLNILYPAYKPSDDTKRILSGLVKEQAEDSKDNPCVMKKLVWLKNEYGI